MKLSVSLKTAVSALRRNKLRALLTALGIIIGIAAIIVMMAIGQGSSRAIQNTIATMGANNLLIMPGTAASGGVSYGAGTTLTLTVEDADALQKEAAFVRYVAPIVRVRSQIIYGNKNWVPQYVYGTTPSFFDVRDWRELAQGSMFTDREVRNGSKVCLLGQTLVKELFNKRSPIGKEIRIQNVAFKVIGVLKAKGANMMGMDQDDIVVAPWTTIKYRLGSSSQTNTAASGASSTKSSSTTGTTSGDTSNALYPTTQLELYPPQDTEAAILSRRLANVDQISATANSSAETMQAVDEITSILRSRHRMRMDEPDDFTVRDMAEMTAVLTTTSNVMTRLLLGVALISLIVGGVGIMNIMLVSVTERTREIGLRMAVGARRKDILQQFLVEAVLLCLGGGIVGIISGALISYIIGTLFGWPIITSLSAIISTTLVSVSIGLIFGFFPARRAAHLDPIEALRYE